MLLLFGTYFVIIYYQTFLWSVWWTHLKNSNQQTLNRIYFKLKLQLSISVLKLWFYRSTNFQIERSQGFNISRRCHTWLKSLYKATDEIQWQQLTQALTQVDITAVDGRTEPETDQFMTLLPPRNFTPQCRLLCFGSSNC